MSSLFFVELTDTYGGEANYCWVYRFVIKASSAQGAISKLAKETGYKFRFDYGNVNDLIRYTGRNASVCVFVEYYDNDNARHDDAKQL